jgi:hypothetical protein
MYPPVVCKPGKSEVAHERAILQIRRYLQVIVLLNGAFVVIVGTVFLLLSFQLRKYTAISSDNINIMALNALTISRNAAQISASVVPISENAQFLTNAIVSTVAGAFNLSLVNSTAFALQNSDGASRHLLFDPTLLQDFVVDENDLLNADLKMRQTMYKLSRTLLQTANEKLSEFNPAAVSDLMEWIVSGVNYSSVATRFDRVLYDVEKTASFGVLATSMLGIAATAANVTVPTTAHLLDVFNQHRAAADDLAPHPVCG